MNGNFEAARANVNFYLGVDLPHAREWKPVTRESGQFAMAHQEPLFLHLGTGNNTAVCKYYFAEEMEINNSKVYKYNHCKGEFCVLVRAVPSEVELYLDGESEDIVVYTVDLMWEYSCKRPVGTKPTVATVTKQVAAALLDENKVTKQTKVRLTDRLGRKLNGNMQVVRKSAKLVRKTVVRKTVPK
jgi:hypothetical protein